MLFNNAPYEIKAILTPAVADLLLRLTEFEEINEETVKEFVAVDGYKPETIKAIVSLLKVIKRAKFNGVSDAILVHTLPDVIILDDDEVNEYLEENK